MTHIIAHRGASYDAPENTLAALSLAWLQNADACEIDTHLSRDGHVIVMHDPNTQRTTGCAAEIAALSLAEIKRLDAGSWKGAAFAGEPVPTLEEVLTMVPDTKRLYIEIKTPGMVPQLKACLERVGSAHAQLVGVSFAHATMTEFKAALPDVEALWIIGNPATAQTALNLRDRLDDYVLKCQRANLQGLSLHQNWFEDEAVLHRIQDADLKAAVWTVNDGSVARRLANAGIDAITTDCPALMRQQISENLGSGT